VEKSSAILVSAGAVLDVSGTGVAGGFRVAAGQSLGGTGVVSGTVTIGAAATVSPGASPGTLTLTENAALAAGGNYNWQVANAAGAAGTSTGWDLLRVGGTLTVAATQADPFRINLWSLSGIGPDVSGSASNFNPLLSSSWTIASAAGGVTGFAPDRFRITQSATNGTGGFANGLNGGTFSVTLSGSTDIALVFSPSSASTTITVTTGTQTQSQAGFPLITGSTTLTKTGGGTLVLDQTNPFTGLLTVNNGVARLAVGPALSASRLAAVTGGTISLTPYLQASVAGLNPNAGGVIDVGSGLLTVQNGLTTSELLTALLHGRSDGTWTGTTGITSSQAAADLTQSMLRTVGWLDNGDGSFTFAYAAPGDTNLDWKVDILDLANFFSAGKYDTLIPATWKEGDFNYDSIVDILDAADFLFTDLFDSGIYNPPTSLLLRSLGGEPHASTPLFSSSEIPLRGIAAVPEPSPGAIVAVVAAVATLAAFRGPRQARRLRGQRRPRVAW
jgi:autotransporter-associated beta strand protein